MHDKNKEGFLSLVSKNVNYKIKKGAIMKKVIAVLLAGVLLLGRIILGRDNEIIY